MNLPSDYNELYIVGYHYEGTDLFEASTIVTKEVLRDELTGFYGGSMLTATSGFSFCIALSKTQASYFGCWFNGVENNDRSGQIIYYR